MVPKPFFESGQHAAGAEVRRLLLISYCFPPDRSVGALRWEKLIPYFVHAGWGVDVVTLDPADMQRVQVANANGVDEARLRSLPPGVRVFGVPHPLLRRQRFIRDVAVPVQRVLRKGRRGASARAEGSAPTNDAVAAASPAAGRSLRTLFGQAKRATLLRFDEAWHRTWADRAAAVATAVLGPAHAAVITSGPPHTAHIAGRIASAARGLPFILDFRDPWELAGSVMDSLGNILVDGKKTGEEPMAVAQAALIVIVSPVLRERMAAAYPDAAARMITVMNGADPETLPEVERTGRFTVAYAGSIYLDRDPRVLFRAARQVIDELKLTPAEFGIEFIGVVETFHDQSVRGFAEALGVGDDLTLGPPRNRRDALAFLATAPMLVNLPQASMTEIPAKLFEYTMFEAWQLVFSPKGAATEILLRGTDADVVDVDDADGAAEALKRRILQFRNGERPAALNADGRFSRATQARKLVDAVRAVCGEPAAAREDTSAAVAGR